MVGQRAITRLEVERIVREFFPHGLPSCTSEAVRNGTARTINASSETVSCAEAC